MRTCGNGCDSTFSEMVSRPAHYKMPEKSSRSDRIDLFKACIHQHLEGVRRSVLADEVATAATQEISGCGAMTHSPSVAFLRALICCSQLVRRLENAVDSSNTAGWQGDTLFRCHVRPVINACAAAVVQNRCGSPKCNSQLPVP